MEKFSKKTLLNYVNGAGLYGAAPTGSSVVKFAWASTLNKIGTGGDGTITFYADANKTGIIAVGDQIVSSKIFDVTSADKVGGKTGEKTITVTYFDNAAKNTATTTFDVVDAAAAKAYFEGYFATSNTIDVSNGVANVRVDGTTVLVDSNDGLKSGLKLVYVPASAQSGETPAVDAHIALSDNSDKELYTIPVASIVGNGVLDHSTYDKEKNILHLFFKTSKAGVFNEIEIPVGEILDINDIIIADDSSIYLNVTPDASVVNLGVKLQDVSTADADHNGLASAKAVREYVDSKTTDLAVKAEGDAYVDATVDAGDNKKINVAATDKTKAAVALAETALQSINKTGTSKTYIDLTIGENTLDGSTQSLEINETALVQKFVDTDASIDALQAKDVEIDASIDALQAKDVEIDASIDALQAKDEEIDASIDALQAKDEEIDASIDALQAKDAEIDGSLGRLNSSVSAIETAIAGMNADLSVNALDGSIGITLSETDGKVTAIGVTATKAETTFTPASEHAQASLGSTSGILTGSAIEDIVAYVNAKSSDLDSSVTGKDTKEFVIVNTVQTDGALSAENVTVVYGDYNDPQTDGLATTSATKTYVDTKIQSLDLANDVADASAVDGAGFVKTVISETDGIVKNESVTVTYGDYSTHANGIAKTADTSVFVEKQITAALTWQVLN